ncbi:MAG: hypothetical protein WBO49_00760, partial [Candidatus Saccharimonas sp.]
PRDRCRSAGADVRTDQREVRAWPYERGVDGDALSGRNDGVQLHLGLAVHRLGLLPAVEGLDLQAGLGVGLDLLGLVARNRLAILGGNVLPHADIGLRETGHPDPLKLATAVSGLALTRARPARIAGRTGIGGSLRRADRER